MSEYWHSLKENYSGWWWQTTLGAKGGLDLFRRVGYIKYWILGYVVVLDDGYAKDV